MKKYMQNRKLITYICDCCNKESQKPESEYNRNIKLIRKNYCSRQCAAKAVGTLLKYKGPKYDISQHHENKKDEFTPFRQYLRKCIKRYKEVNITIEDVKNQWDSQNGICPYSGIKLQLKDSENIIYKPSIDRIDSSKGYIKGNIQFTSIAINFMKSNMSHEETITLCKFIALHNS